jgi:hypothetical protein
MKFNQIKHSGKELLKNVNPNILYMTGKNREGDAFWVRITYGDGRILKRATISSCNYS